MIFRLIKILFFVKTYIEEEIEHNDALSAFTRATVKVSSNIQGSRKFSLNSLIGNWSIWFIFPWWNRIKLYFYVIIASKSKSRARCKWGKWRTSSCSRSCGGGVYTRTRSRVSLRRGTICKGLERIQRRCNRKKCPKTKPSKKKSLYI